jgi:hypothetical protein
MDNTYNSTYTDFTSKKCLLEITKILLLHTCEVYASLMYSTIYYGAKFEHTSRFSFTRFQLLVILSKTSNTVKLYYWINVLWTYPALRDLKKQYIKHLRVGLGADKDSSEWFAGINVNGDPDADDLTSLGFYRPKNRK